MTGGLCTVRLRQFIVTVCAAIAVGLNSGGAPAAGTAGAAAAQSKPVARTGVSLPTVSSYAIDPVHTFVRFSAQHKVVAQRTLRSRRQPLARRTRSATRT